MNSDKTNNLNIEICDNLFKKKFINFKEYLECKGVDEMRNPLLSDEHKYGVKYNKHIKLTDNSFYIHYDNNYYLAVINNTLSITTGIFNEDDNIFEMEKMGVSKYGIRHTKTGLYISYSLKDMTLSLKNKKYKENQFLITSYINNNGIIYYNISIKNNEDLIYLALIDDKLKLTNKKFNWNLKKIDNSKKKVLNETLIETRVLINKYNKNLEKYNIIKHQKNILNNLLIHIDYVISNVVNYLKQLERNNEIDLTEERIDLIKYNTIKILDSRELFMIRNYILDLDNEITVMKNDLDNIKIEINSILINIDKKIENKNTNILENKNLIHKYNNTLGEHNILLDIDKYKNYDIKNKEKIIKSEINKEIKNKINNNKSYLNIFFITIISLLLIIIIIQFSMKIL